MVSEYEKHVISAGGPSLRLLQGWVLFFSFQSSRSSHLPEATAKITPGGWPGAPGSVFWYLGLGVLRSFLLSSSVELIRLAA